MALTDDEAADEVARMKARQVRRAYHRPQIDRYREDLVKLRQLGSDFRGLSDWLARQRIPVAATPLAVGRWFDRGVPGPREAKDQTETRAGGEGACRHSIRRSRRKRSFGHDCACANANRVTKRSGEA